MCQFAAYAGPSVWGDWQEIADNIGVVSYNITASAVGSTVFRSRVRYFKDSGQVVEEFGDSTRITTGDTVAKVEVSFKGIPMGSAIEGTVEP